MAHLRPLRAVRYDPQVVDVGSVLAPPYDVINAAQQDELYSRNLRNVVRIDFGADLAGDVSGSEDRYTRARGHLESWLSLGILRRDERPALYVTDHEFLGEDGERHVRRGLFGRVPARPWSDSEVLPHELTMRGPKEDRLALMRSTRMQTSAVWVVWDHAPGIAEALAAATARDPDASGETAGELDVERLRLWVVDDPGHLAAIATALAPARLYIADGHHRFETAAAYAAERHAAEPGAPEDADFAMTLVYACAADDPVVEVWPTHRLVKATKIPSPTDVLGALVARLGTDWSAQPTRDLATATSHARAIGTTHHAFGVLALDGAAVLSTPRENPEGPAADREGRRAAPESPAASLDTTILADRILGDALSITPEQITAGALSFTRDVAEATRAVQSGEATLAFTLNPTSTAEIIAVSDAGEVMPQKSSYFYPKVPTGLLLSPL